MVNPATSFLKTHLFSFHHTQVPWKLAIISPFLAFLLLSWIHSSIHFTDAETKAKLNQLPKVTVSKWGTKYVRHYYWDWECRNKQKRQKSLPPRSSPSSYSLHTTTIIITLASPQLSISIAVPSSHISANDFKPLSSPPEVSPFLKVLLSSPRSQMQ